MVKILLLFLSLSVGTVSADEFLHKVIEETKNKTLLLANPPNILLEIVSEKYGEIIKIWQKNMKKILKIDIYNNT